MRWALLLGLAAALAAAAAACGGASGGSAPAAPPATLGAGALPGLESRARALDAAALAADAFEPAPLERVLEDGGYESGREREFTGKSATFDHVVARSLRFRDADGADAYLGWLSAHPGDLLGQAQAERPLSLGGSPLLFSLVRCGSCKKELPTYLAAWREGSDVRFLLAAGQGATRRRVEALARELDRAGG